MTFSTHELHQDQAFERAELFSIDRRHNAVKINLGANNYVVTVSDDDQMNDALRAAGADILGRRFSYARDGFVRSALRPSSRGAGRDRWR
ncbi:MAG TPA: hypothetical protein VFX25_14785 [Streptosporangiaceae bacterium]|nr:hypothetical protein [Streptosporangiaceae bacterium]